MTTSLRDIRKAAGYKSAKELADKMGIPTPTFSRYEQSPDKIPIKAAWALADALGCTIDEVVGRVDQNAPTPGSVQAIYDGLAPASKAQVDEYLVFIVGKEADAEKRAAAAEKALYAGQAQPDGDASDRILFGTPGDARNAFAGFVSNALESKKEKSEARFKVEWLDHLCSAPKPNFDMYIGADGRVHGESEDLRESTNALLDNAVSNNREELEAHYREVMEKIMQAYDATHPESAPGPCDSTYLFDRFISMMEQGDRDA